MYENVMNSLRVCGRIESTNDTCIAFHDGCCEAEPLCHYELMRKAADAIEHLELEAAALQTEAGGNVMAEKEYIEREAVMDALFHEQYGYLCEDAINSIPAADVRPVVTCGECKHWFENGTDYCSCDRDALLRERDFFCAAGEKREES